MNDESVKVLCLQKHPEYYDQTITLLNNQWPRSRTARLRSLEQGSKDGLPTSLILVQPLPGSGKRTVIAHSKISPVPHKPQWCFVESVVVAPELRGKGLGRLIMQATEEYVKRLNVTTVYLTTFDQQDFYHKLGYEYTEPIVVFGGSLKLADRTDNFSVFQTCHSVNNEEKCLNVTDNACVHSNPAPPSANSQPLPTTTPPPPPPPPPPPSPSMTIVSINNNNCNAGINTSKLTMRKFLQN